MLEMIRKVLARSEVSAWAVEEVSVQSAELFFIRRELDTRRLKETEKYHVRVYRDFEKNGKAMRGMSTVTFVPTQTEDDVERGIRSACYAASFVENPAYPLPGKQVAEPVDDNGFGDLSAAEAGLKMAQALFSADTAERAWINSAEIFATRSRVRLMTDCGTDVAYTRHRIGGEFVVQCREPEDVEIYRDFRYDTPDGEALAEKAGLALQQVEDRARAEKGLVTGEYNVILSDDNVAELLSYYVGRTGAGMVYPGYSSWKVGDAVQPEGTLGEKLELTLRARAPFSGEGVPMVDRPLLREGRVALCHGGARLSAYLGIPPTGDYSAFSCENGSTALEDMKKEPYLYPVVFSDFQMDPFSGHFGGEIRLAYWFDGEKTRVVTGGSINGSMIACSRNLTFSRETYKSLSYEGPFAVLLKGVSVAGE